jgi:hypothetical protein
LFRLSQNWDVRVGVSPEREEILIGFATLAYVARERRRAGQTEMR